MAMASVERRSAVAVLTLNDPTRYNALAWDRPCGLNAAWRRRSPVACPEGSRENLRRGERAKIHRSSAAHLSNSLALEELA